MLLTPAVGCSDDGLPVQGQNSTTGTSGGSGGGSGGGSLTADPGDTGATADGGSEGPSASSSDGATTGPEGGSSTGATGGSTSTGEIGSSSSTGDTEGSSSSGDMCMPITEDASDVGSPCQIDADCAPGYTCQTFIGFALEQSCQILCTQTCECPMGLTCTFTQDKVASWNQCAP